MSWIILKMDLFDVFHPFFLLSYLTLWFLSGILIAAVSQAGETQNVKHNKECIDLSKLESLLNSVPLDDKVGSSEKEESCALPPIPPEPFSTETKDIQSGTMSFPELLIIMNTQSSEKEMIVSRRSTYQKILALEKYGAQVIERDSNLPADIIISPAVCLVWYECSNMLKKSNGSHGASSWLPCHVENIATNILNFLSFSFSGCILVILCLTNSSFFFSFSFWTCYIEDNAFWSRIELIFLIKFQSEN